VLPFPWDWSLLPLCLHALCSYLYYSTSNNYNCCCLLSIYSIPGVGPSVLKILPNSTHPSTLGDRNYVYSCRDDETKSQGIYATCLRSQNKEEPEIQTQVCVILKVTLFSTEPCLASYCPLMSYIYLSPKLPEGREFCIALNIPRT